MTVTKRKPKGLLLPVQESKPVHSHKKSENDHIKSCRFLNLEDVSLATGVGTLTRKNFLPDLKIDHCKKNPIITKIVVTGNPNMTLEINPIKTLS